MCWYPTTISTCSELLLWLIPIRGRQKAFWISTFSKDITPAVSISGTTLTAYNDILSRPAPYDLEIVGNSTHRVRVTDAVAGATVNGRPTVDLTLDQSVTESLANIRRISRLICSRLDTDRVEIEYQGSNVSTIAVTCKEISEP
mgnify:CR=1 FL=1